MRLCHAALILSLTVTSACYAAAPALTVDVEGISNGAPVPATQAVCLPTADGKNDASGNNQPPKIRWSGAPKSTASFAIFMMDPDVPADFTDAGKEGKIIAKNAKRQDFYHYGVVNIPATATQYPAADANSAYGTAIANDMGINKYVTPVNAYGGPCPPWNDARVHHYHYIVLALDKDAPIHVVHPIAHAKRSAADEPNIAKNTFNRLISSKHVLAKGVVIGTYTLNTTLRNEAEKTLIAP